MNLTRPLRCTSSHRPLLAATAPQASPANPVSALLGTASPPSGLSSLAAAPGEARSCSSAVIPVCLCCVVDSPS